MSIYEALHTIQQELKANKGQFNKFGNYNYRSCEDILEAVKPLLKKTNTVLYFRDVIENIGERYYLATTLTLQSVEKPDESIFVTAYAREEESKKGMDGSQITGASSSYARKYALNSMFAIDDTKDSDTTNTHGKAEPYFKSEDKIEKDVEQKTSKLISDKIDILVDLGQDRKAVETALEKEEDKIKALDKWVAIARKKIKDAEGEKEPVPFTRG